MKPKKTENLSFRLSAEDKALLDDIAEEIGCSPSALACKATEVWIAACRKGGGYIKPEFSATQAIYEDREKELIQMVAEELGLYKPAETKKKTG